MSKLSTAGLALALAACVLPAGVSAQAAGPADLILTNGVVHTVDEARPRAQAVAVRDGRIAFVGSAREVEALRGPGTRVVDLGGKAVYPGFVDSHGHLGNLGSMLRNVDLVGTRSLEEVVGRVRVRAERTPAGSWIVGRGWDQNEWSDTRFPTHEALSAALPDHPVVLERVDGHAYFVNAAAMELAGIDADTPDPEGGRIVRDPETGEATGVLVDNAMLVVDGVVPPESDDQKREGVRLAQRELNRVGLTSIHDAGMDAATAALYEEMAEAGELTVRNHAMLRLGLEELAPFFERGPRMNVDGEHFLNVAAIKVSIDGALGSRGAALLEDYSDEPGNDGLILVPVEELEGIAARALESGFQLNVHAIGDRGNRVVLDVFEQALAAHPTADHRWRVEHAQILHRHDLPRFAELGVIPSMQAIHQASDMAWVPDRLGYTRSLGTYAWRSLLDSGVIIPGGSDFPVEPADPLLSFHAAVTRQNTDGWPTGGWFPSERMTRDEALQHMTIWGAHAAFMEDEVGSLTPGKLADIVVFDRDLMSVPAEEIPQAEVVMTIVGGDVVYERSGGAGATAAAGAAAAGGGAGR